MTPGGGPVVMVTDDVGGDVIAMDDGGWGIPVSDSTLKMDDLTAPLGVVGMGLIGAVTLG